MNGKRHGSWETWETWETELLCVCAFLFLFFFVFFCFSLGVSRPFALTSHEKILLYLVNATQQRRGGGCHDRWRGGGSLVGRLIALTPQTHTVPKASYLQHASVAADKTLAKLNERKECGGHGPQGPLVKRTTQHERTVLINTLVGTTTVLAIGILGRGEREREWNGMASTETLYCIVVVAS